MKRKLTHLATLCLAAVCALALVGCGASPEKLIRDDLDSQLKQVDVNNEDFMGIIETSVGDSFSDLGIEPKDFMTSYLEGWEYEIGDITVDESAGTAEANVNFKLKSMSEIVQNFSTQWSAYVLGLSELPGDTELYAKAGEILMDCVDQAQASDHTAAVPYTKDGDTWTSEETADDVISEAMMA